MRKALPTITESAGELQRQMQREKDGKKRQRVHALYLAASGQVRHRQEIAALLGVHRHSVAAWFAAYAAGGLAHGGFGPHGFPVPRLFADRHIITRHEAAHEAGIPDLWASLQRLAGRSP